MIKHSVDWNNSSGKDRGRVYTFDRIGGHRKDNSYDT